MKSIKLDLIKGSDLGNGQIADFQIEQGATFEILLPIQGDKTAGTYRGEVRTDYLSSPDSTLLATFAFNNVAFDPQTGQTNFLAEIDAIQTDAMPPTFNAGKGVRGEINDGYYVYDIEYEETGKVFRFYEGLAEVTPQSTNGGTP